MDEEKLVFRAKEGQREAFDKLYQKYKRPILNYIYRFIGNYANAEELTQEAFVRAYMNIAKFEHRAKFSSWLYRIAANLAKNYLRHASYDKRAEPIRRDSYDGYKDVKHVIDTLEDTAKRPDELAQRGETERFVQEAIDKLPVSLKEAVILCDIEGFSYEEAAKIMSCRPMTVGSRLWRGRERLAALLRHIKNGNGKK